MGMFFSNLHIKKTGGFTVDELSEMLTTEMQSKGYTKLDSSENAETELMIYAPENSGWVSVASDFYNFGDDKDTAVAAVPLSEKFGTYVIAAACIDSDFAFMHLLNAADMTDGWINSGTPYEGMKLPRRTSSAPWKKVISDFDKFKAVIKENYTFAEEVFYNSAELLGMTAEQCALEPGRTDGLDEKCLIRLYFRLPEGTKKELPRFQIARFNLMPCAADLNQVVFVNNIGGRSKGIAIIFTGDWIENDEVVIYDATFEYKSGPDKWNNVPVTFTKRKDNTGKYILWWQDENFNIPPAVNRDIPATKRMKLEFEKEFGIRFFVRGNERKFLDIKVFIIPLENYHNGADCWYVYRYKGTKRNYVEKENEKILNNIREFEKMPGLSEKDKQHIIEQCKTSMIPMDKYDLD